MKYKLIKTNVECEGEIFNTYGISFGNNIINDISYNKEKVKNLVKLFNDNDLSLIHFETAVEEFLENCQ